ncbi:MAG: hypothetical protein WB783_18380 [Arenicellales bacterium]
MTEPSRRKGILIVSLIAATFLLPVVAAYLWHPSGDTVNYGTLIQPAKPLEAFKMTDLSGHTAGLDVLRGKWTLLYVGSGSCAEECRHDLYKIERVRLAQGRNMERVQSLYLAPWAMQSRAVADTLVQYRGLHGYRISREELSAMAPGLGLAGDADRASGGRIYVVDPLGNLMMFYPADADPTGIKKDLERLLRASQIG